MASMNGVFKVSVTGLNAAQRGLSTTAHNIANADTPGFSRQSAEFVTRPAFGTAGGFIGNGVVGSTVRRVVDEFLNVELRTETGRLAEAKTIAELSAQLDNFLASSASAVGASVNSFFGAMQDLSADPSSTVARELLLSEADNLASRFSSVDGRLNALRDSADDLLRSSVAEVNELAVAIAQLNEAIARERGAFQQPPNDLLDQRDALVRRISEHIDVSTYAQDNGAINVSVASGQSLVTGSMASRLAVGHNPFDPSQAEISIVVGSVRSVITAQVRGGAIAGAVNFRDGLLQSTQNQLGQLAISISAAVNERHRLGQDLSGRLGQDLFTALFDSPRVRAHESNVGDGQISATVISPSSVSASDYLLQRSGGAYTLTRLDDGVVTNLTGFPTNADIIDGVEISLVGGTLADGDQFLVSPTRAAAGDFALEPLSADALAAALPIRADASAANRGPASATLAVNAPSNDLLIRFGPGATTYDVVDRTSGATLLSGASYVSGADIAVNGLSFAISGAPARRRRICRPRHGRFGRRECRKRCDWPHNGRRIRSESHRSRNDYVRFAIEL